MTDRLATALRGLEGEVREAPPAEVPALLGELERLRVMCWARLVTPGPTSANGERPEPDVVHDVHEVARIVRRSVSWVRKRGHTLPGFRQPGGRGARVEWARRRLEAWAAGGIDSHTGAGI